MSDRDRLIKLLLKEQEASIEYAQQKIKAILNNAIVDCLKTPFEFSADYLLANGVIVPPCKVGDEIWVIDREDGEAVDISCIQFLAKSKGCIIGTAWINDLDIDETIEYHIKETQENFDCELKVYPDEDCFTTEEEAKAKLKELNNGTT